MSQIIIKTSILEMKIAVARAIPEVLDQTADDVKDNIEFETYRNHSGRFYPSRREPGVMHHASAPGESFASDTASLISGMEKEVLGPLTMAVNFGDPEGHHRWQILEFGGGRIAARPTIIPVVTHMQDQFTKDVAGAVLRALTQQELK